MFVTDVSDDKFLCSDLNMIPFFDSFKDSQYQFLIYAYDKLVFCIHLTCYRDGIV